MSASSGRSRGLGDYARGTTALSVGIAATGLVTYAYFSLASHSLSASDYGSITLLWSVVFVTVSVLYRPVEQLLARTIAAREAHDQRGSGHLRVAATIQLALGLVFAGAALLLRGPIEDELLGGSAILYWVLVPTVLAYAASYYARGYLAGTRRLGAYGGLVLLESVSRCLFALAVAIGLASGRTVVALGVVAAPIASLAVVPWALGPRLRAVSRSPRPPASTPDDGADADAAQAAALEGAAAGEPELSFSRGAGFAGAVVLIMASEQTMFNAGPLLIKATEGAAGAALAGFAFNALLIARAPLVLFQAVQTSILPHLTRLGATGESEPFRRSVNLTLAAIAAFATLVALAMLAFGPELMGLVFGGDFEYERTGLVLLSVGMGLYLCGATLNQAALARGRSRQAAVGWVAAAAVFVAFLLGPRFDDRVLQVEIGFLVAAAVLAAALYALQRGDVHAGNRPRMRRAPRAGR